MPTRPIVLAFLLLLIPAHLLNAQATRPATQEAGDYSVIEIVRPDGTLAREAIATALVRARATQLDDEFAAAGKAWETARRDFYKDRANTDKNFDLPHPRRATLRTVKLRLTEEAANALVEEIRTKETQRKTNTFFASMLGTYTNKAGPIAFVNLSVPNGENVCTENILRQLRNTVELPLYVYTGTASITIPADGAYLIDANQEVMLDGKSLGEITKTPAPVDIQKGVHEIKIVIHNRRGRLPTARLAIKSPATGAAVPIYNNELAIEAFMSTRIDGKTPVEVSGWTPAGAAIAKP